MRFGLIDASSYQQVYDLVEARVAGLKAKGIPDFGLGVLDSIREDPEVSRLLRHRSLQVHTRAINALAFAPDGSRLISGGTDGALKVVGIDGHEYATLYAGSAPIRDVALSRDGERMMTVADGRTRVWLVAHPDPVREAKAMATRATALASAGQCNEALPFYDFAVSRYQSQLAIRSIESIEQQLVVLLVDRGTAHLACDHATEADRDITEAVQRAEAGLRRGASSAWRGQLLHATLAKAMVYRKTGAHQQAKASAERVIQLAGDNEAVAGASKEVRELVARTHALIATIDLNMHDVRSAIRELSAAVEIFEGMGDFPGPETNLSFSSCLHNRAIAYAANGKQDGRVGRCGPRARAHRAPRRSRHPGAKREHDLSTKLCVAVVAHD